MKKIYQTPEMEVYFIKEFCQKMNEGPSEQGGEVIPKGNECHIFEEKDIASDLTVPSNLWDD